VAVRLQALHPSGRAAFSALDTNGDKWITLPEFQAGLAALSLEPPLSEADVNQLFRYADRSDDGLLSVSEFLEWVSWVPSVSSPLNDSSTTIAGTGTADVGSKSRDIGLVRRMQALASLTSRHEDSDPSTAPVVRQSSTEQRRCRHLKFSGAADLGDIVVLGGGGILTYGDKTVSGLAGGRPTVAPRGVLLKRGCYFYECTVMVAGDLRVGWADCFHVGAAGESHHSWALVSGAQSIAGSHTTLLQSGSSKTGVKVDVAAGDVIGTWFDLSSKKAYFSVNGRSVAQSLGPADVVVGVYPIVTFESNVQVGSPVDTVISGVLGGFFITVSVLVFSVPVEFR
jgi:hypothetical protein